MHNRTQTHTKAHIRIHAKAVVQGSHALTASCVLTQQYQLQTPTRPAVERVLCRFQEGNIINEAFFQGNRVTQVFLF